jgi:hypothetical protein
VYRSVAREVEAALIDKLELARQGRQSPNAHAEEVGILTIVLKPLGDLDLIWERTSPRIDRP